MVSNIFGLTIHNNLTIDGKLGTTLIITGMYYVHLSSFLQGKIILNNTRLYCSCYHQKKKKTLFQLSRDLNTKYDFVIFMLY